MWWAVTAASNIKEFVVLTWDTQKWGCLDLLNVVDVDLPIPKRIYLELEGSCFQAYQHVAKKHL